MVVVLCVGIAATTWEKVRAGESAAMERIARLEAESRERMHTEAVAVNRNMMRDAVRSQHGRDD